jgi:hypothetical protein
LLQHASDVSFSVRDAVSKKFRELIIALMIARRAENGRMAMVSSALNSTAISKGPILVIAIVVAFASSPATAAQRPISDFLSAQGVYCDTHPADPGCANPEPGEPLVPALLGWTGPPPDYPYIAAIDYPGIMGKWVVQNGGPQLGTVITGSINERALPDGRANVQVTLHTKNALAWVDTSPQLTPRPIFGQRATAVARGAQASLADCNFSLAFTNNAPGAPLPDLLTLLFDFDPARQVHAVSIRCTGVGELASGGKAQLVVSQTGNFRTRFQGTALRDGFPVEELKLAPVGPREISFPPE